MRLESTPKPKAKGGKGDTPDRERSKGVAPDGGKANAGKGKPKSNSPCFAFQTGTCVRGKECGYAHVKDTGAPQGNGGGQGTPSKTQCTFFLQGDCMYGEE